MPKINQEEYEVLQFLNNTKDWIVRNPDGQLWAVEGEAPWKAPFYETWKENDGQDTTKVDVNSFLFQFIQWEDEEPYNIAELIEEYENSPEYVTYISNERTRILSNDLWSKLESEETEVKNIEWLKDEILTDMRYLEGNREIRQLDIKYQTLREVAQKINSLDEPEVLTQEFIDKYKVDYDNWMPAVPIVHLQNLLVPKQEEVDRAYKDGYEKGKEHATEKQSEETETVARVLVDYLIASAKLKLALSMEVEELEE